MSLLLTALLAAADANVALLSEGCDAPTFVDLVRAELQAAGFSTGAPPADGEIARLTLVCGAGVVDVHLEDHVTRKRVERRLVRADDDRAEVRTAVQVVELLHASLAEARYRTASVPREVEAFLESKEPSVGRAWAALLGGAVVAPGGFGAQPGVSGLLADQLGPVELSGLLGATVRATTLQGPGGAAEVGLFDASVGVGLRVPLAAIVLHPRLGLGALVVWAAGRASQGWVASAGFTGTFAPSLGVVVEVPVARRLAIVGAFTLLVTPVPVEVRFADASGARIGSPLLSASLGVAAR